MNKFTISINSRWCKRCGLCASVCPKSVFQFTIGHQPVAAHPEACIGCMQCQWRCPDFAISIDTVKSQSNVC